MNNLTAKVLGLDGNEFIRFMKYMFDDTFEIDEEYSKHSSCNVERGVEIDLEIATDLVQSFCLPVAPADLVGVWAFAASSDYSWGIEWDMVDCAYRVEQVTETITVTKWKPVQDAEPATEESVQPFPGCKK
ncbi:gp59 [Erwinia phage vB_EamM-Y2]|uniref:Gp59 n=1 Tax=Erwinia phage vB_EamM-Y2 TaxID=1051676 RepID=G0YQ08_9CAUD|nr:gp59 [Erwinia phage vB_EamM-Y2]AEJ81435.1 gp59 [Erwinia phage vB_EamM-Y2]